MPVGFLYGYDLKTACRGGTFLTFLDIKKTCCTHSKLILPVSWLMMADAVKTKYRREKKITIQIA